MKRSSLLTKISAWILGVFLCMGLAVTHLAMAVDGDPPGLFQLDGDSDETINSIGGSTNGDDWDLLFNSGGTPLAFTGILTDPAPNTIFWKGGSKDIHDISSWWHRDGSVPDKDDITNAYAAAYLSPDEACIDPDDPTMEVTCEVGTEGVDWDYIREVDDLIVYFGFDRFANTGDAFGGFWFFQNAISANTETNRFDGGDHVAKTLTSPGDVLMLVEYPQGANAVPVIKAYEWDPGDVDGDGNMDSDGHSLGDLDQIFSSENSGVSAECDGADFKIACAITNDEVDGAGHDIGEIDVDWPYTPKSGTAGSPPFESFFEGGVNLTQLLGDTLCISSFLAESRASRSETATLKDFVLGDFNVCSATIRTEIHEEPGHLNNVDGSSIDVGKTIHDAAYLAIEGPPGVEPPTGTITFARYPNLTCSGNIFTEETKNLSTGDTSGSADILAGEIRVEASSETPAGATALSYLASYSGDENYAAVTAACETLTVNKFASTVTTNIHAGDGTATHSTTDIQGGSVTATQVIHDLANVTGAGPKPTGIVTFKFFSDNSCTPANEVVANGSTGDLTTGTEAGDITGGRKVASANFDTTGYTTTTAGTYLSYRASYGGDANYLPATDSSCEVLLVQKLQPTVVTNIHLGTATLAHEFGVTTDIQDTTITIGATVHDVAAVTGSGVAPTGNVVFKFYDDVSCTNEIVPNSSTKNLGTDGEAITGGRSVESANFDTTGYVTSGSNRVLAYMASYSGDLIYVAADDSSCEDLLVEKLTPTVVTEIHSGGRNAGHLFANGLDIQDTDFTIGGTLHDMASVTGSGPTPTGNVVFKFYTDDECTNEIPGNSSTNALTGAGLAESDDFDTTGYVTGTDKTKVLAYMASYEGDGTYIAADDSSCEDLRVVKRLPSILTKVIVLDLAELSGDGGSVDPTGNIDFRIYAGTGCTGALLATVNDVSMTNLVATLPDSAKQTIAASGSISYLADYDGDANYVPVTHACENVTATLPGATQGDLL